MKLEVESGGTIAFSSIQPADKNEPYTVSLVTTNISSVSIPGFDLSWTESRVQGFKPQIPPGPGVAVGSAAVPALRFGSKATVSLGTFKHNWEWIDAANPVLDIKSIVKDGIVSGLQELAKDLGAKIKQVGILGTIEGIIETIIDTTLSTERVNTYRYSASAVDGPALTGDFVSDVTVGVPVIRLGAYGAYVGMAGVARGTLATGLAEAAFALFFGGPLAPELLLATVPTFLAGVAQLAAAAAYYELAKDPPDPDYTSAVLVKPIVLSHIEPELSGPVRESTLLHLNLIALREAEVIY
jgi:hypothetical protein